MVIYKKWFGKKLTELREAAGFSTQDKLATKIGAKNALVSRWENGISFPSPKYFGKICAALKVKPDQFLEFTVVHVQRNELTLTDAVAILDAFAKIEEPRKRNLILETLDLSSLSNPDLLIAAARDAVSEDSPEHKTDK